MGSFIRNSALLIIILVFVGFFGYWSTQVELDEMARIQGVVIPSSKEKVIQSEFNGRLIEINIKLGDRMNAGDLIVIASRPSMRPQAGSMKVASSVKNSASADQPSSPRSTRSRVAT